MQGYELGKGDDVITLHNAANNFPVPAAAGIGGDCSRWQTLNKNVGPAAVDLQLKGSAGTTLTGPVAVYVEDDTGSPDEVGVLNGGADIVIPNAVVGVRFSVNVGPFKRLAIACKGATTAPSGGATVTVKARPIIAVET